MDDLCTACLCAGRNLYFIGETGHYHLYSQILNEIPVYDFSDVCVRVCWECRAVLRRFAEFKMLVKRSYTELLQQLHQNSPSSRQYLIRPTRLLIHRLASVSIPNIKDEPLDGEITSAPLDVVKEEIEIPVLEEIKAAKKDTKDKVKKSKLKKKAKVKKKKPTKKKRAETPVDEPGGLMHGADSDDCDTYDDNVVDKVEELETEADVMRGSAEDTVTEKEVKKKESPKKAIVVVKVDFPAPALVGGKPKCPECGKMFSSNKTYRYHLNTLHKGQNRYPCPRCGKVYQWKSNLGRHMRSHQALDSGELYCALCARGFASVATYRQHLRISRRHVAETDFTFSCNECGKRFVNKTRLRDHVDWDHLHKVKFRCQLCDKPFKCHTSLYVHTQNVHRNKKRENLCHICGKSYQNAAKLKYHIVAMHTSETPYACRDCGAAFGWYSSLYRHAREVHAKMKLQPKKPRKPKRGDLPPEALVHALPGPA